LSAANRLVVPWRSLRRRRRNKRYADAEDVPTLD